MSGIIAAIAPPLLTAQTLPTTPASPGNPPDNPQAILESDDAPQDVRDLAAIRLLATRDDHARAIVINALTGGSAADKISLCRALTAVKWPDPGFVQPLFSLMRGRDAGPAAAAATALAEYPEDPLVLQQLILQAKSDRTDVRQAAIRSLGNFNQKLAARTLLDLLQQNDLDPVRDAAGSALMQLTGRYDLDHDSARWSAWWQQNGSLADPQFREVVFRGRGDAFETLVAGHRTLENAADDFLGADFWNAVPEKRAGILLSYLRSSAPEIRALGAELVYSSATATGAPPGTIQQTRLLLSDPSPQVRAAAAVALSADAASAGDLVAQLARESDDFVRVRLINSLAPFADLRAIQQMLKLVGPGNSSAVRIAAANAIREGSEVVNADATLKSQAKDTLIAALQDTEVPGQQVLRTAIVAAIASIHDDSLSDLLLRLISQNEPTGVRASALVGLGNLPNPAPFATEISRHLDDEDSQMRLAAIQALRHPPAPIPTAFITKLLSLMNEDGNDQVRAAAWETLQDWSSTPAMDEAGISTLAQGLKSQPQKELIIRQKLCDRLAADIRAGAALPGGHSPAQELAEQQQTVGDLMMTPAINRPSEAADKYRAALDYWKSNQGRADVIDRLCGDIIDALLAAKRWDDAAAFGSATIKQYGNDPNLRVTSQTVAREFVVAAGNLQESSDPGSYADAIALLDAVKKMDPPLPPDYADQLASRRAAIEARHAASSRP